MFHEILEAIKIFIVYINSTQARIGACLFSTLFMKFAPTKLHGVDLTFCHNIMPYLLIIASFLLMIDIVIWLNNIFHNIKYTAKKQKVKQEFFEKLSTLDQASLNILSWFYTQNNESIRLGFAFDKTKLQRLLELNLVFTNCFDDLYLEKTQYLDYLREYFKHSNIKYTSQTF